MAPYIFKSLSKESCKERKREEHVQKYSDFLEYKIDSY